jgi:hypothetical protein
MGPMFQRPSSDVLVWETVPKFFQPTSTPRGTVIVEGWNAKSTIFTLPILVGTDRAGCELAVELTDMSATAAAQTNTARAFAMDTSSSLWLGRLGLTSALVGVVGGILCSPT